MKSIIKLYLKYIKVINALFIFLIVSGVMAYITKRINPDYVNIFFYGCVFGSIYASIVTIIIQNIRCKDCKDMKETNNGGIE